MPPPITLKYLAGYPPEWLLPVQRLIDDGRLGETIVQRYPEQHAVRTDPALHAYVMDLKNRFMLRAPPLAKAVYDTRLQVLHNALGTHTTAARVQGGRLKAKREIRVAALFKDAPAAFLRMIVVHELAHLKERDHGKPFYALCRHMAEDYHQLEFDTRLWLTARELEAAG